MIPFGGQAGPPADRPLHPRPWRAQHTGTDPITGRALFSLIRESPHGDFSGVREWLVSNALHHRQGMRHVRSGESLRRCMEAGTRRHLSEAFETPEIRLETTPKGTRWLRERSDTAVSCRVARHAVATRVLVRPVPDRRILAYLHPSTGEASKRGHVSLLGISSHFMRLVMRELLKSYRSPRAYHGLTSEERLESVRIRAILSEIQPQTMASSPRRRAFSAHDSAFREWLSHEADGVSIINEAMGWRGGHSRNGLVGRDPATTAVLWGCGCRRQPARRWTAGGLVVGRKTMPTTGR